MRAYLLAIGLAAGLCGARATPAAAQRYPTAHCYDGTYYYGTNRSQACAHHRGVSEWLARPQPMPREPRPAASARRTPARHPSARRPAARPRAAQRPPAMASARCKDGSWSFDRRRSMACARHGGIARWLGRR